MCEARTQTTCCTPAYAIPFPCGAVRFNEFRVAHEELDDETITRNQECSAAGRDEGLVDSSAGFVVEGAASIPVDVLEFLQEANYTTLLALLGGVPKAPEDGETYAMRDGEWVALVLPTP